MKLHLVQVFKHCWRIEGTQGTYWWWLEFVILPPLNDSSILLIIYYKDLF